MDVDGNIHLIGKKRQHEWILMGMGNAYNFFIFFKKHHLTKHLNKLVLDNYLNTRKVTEHQILI